jgi:hypothetical protein
MAIQWSKHQCWASLLALALPACAFHSVEAQTSEDLTAEQDAASTSADPAEQEPAQGPQADTEEPVPPSPRWRSLNGPMNGQQDATGLSLFHESVEFDTDADAPATMQFTGIRYANCGETWSFDAELASPRVTVDDELGDESGSSFFAAAGASTNWLPSDGFALQPRLGIGYGQCEVSLPLPLLLTRADTELEWFQGDLTLAASYLPAADSAYALAPSGGIGFRYLDGFHQFADGSTREFDAALAYGFVGAHWSQCVGDSSRWALEAMAMVGQLEGFQISFSFFF